MYINKPKRPARLDMNEHYPVIVVDVPLESLRIKNLTTGETAVLDLDTGELRINEYDHARA